MFVAHTHKLTLPIEQKQDTEFLEISNIRDTRTGKYAKVPRNVSELIRMHALKGKEIHHSPFFFPNEQEGKLKESINIGPGDVPLEDKTLTVVYGADFVNVNFINFCTFSKEIAQVSVVLFWRGTSSIYWMIF